MNGSAVRALREARGIRQADLARTIGISRTHMNQIESSTKGTTEERLGVIAVALGVEVDAISHPVHYLVTA